MKRLYSVIQLVLFALVFAFTAKAQTTISTTTAAGFTNSNGSGQVTFNFQNTNAYAVIITDIASICGASTTQTIQAWYNTTPINGTPAMITGANGWTQFGSGSITGILNSTTLVTQPFFSGLTLMVPANTTYGISISATNLRYSNLTAGVYTVPGGGCNIISGTNIGWGGTVAPAAPTIALRGFLGSVTFTPAVPCTSPPTAGTANVNNSNPCPGNPLLFSLTGNSGGTGQTYAWESSATIGGPYTPVTSSSPSPSANLNATSTLYYRAAVECNSIIAYSQPVLVTVGSAHPGGTFTINGSLPTGGLNFHSFTDAISAIKCGLTGPIVFNVDSASGPYNEQVTIPAIGTASNTITINGNGAVLTFSSINAGAPHTLALNGTDYVTVNNLHIEGTGATYALTCHLWNQADNNSFNNCYFGCPANGTSTTHVPFSLSGSETVATTTGLSGNNNTITGCTMFGGYYNTCIVGNSAGVNTGNQLINCRLLDFYAYGSYNLYQNGLIVRGNLIERPTRTTLTSFYGIYVLTGCTNTLVERNIIRNPYGGNPLFNGLAYAIYSSIDGSVGNENKYFNNLIYNMNGIGAVAGMYMTLADYFQAYHNTILIDYTAATAGLTYGIYSTGTLGGKDIRDNIISITRGGTGTKYCLYFSGPNPISDYNDLYISSTAGINNVGFFAVDVPTLANWQATNGNVWDANSKDFDPVFANAAAGDMTPTNSLLDNMGTPLASVSTDFFGNARSLTTPDMGGIEFAVPPCGGTPAPGIVTGPTGICSGINFNLSLTGFTIGTGISIAWESSPAGQGIWTPMTGTTSTINTSITSSTDYRAIVTCANGGGFAFSNVFPVTLNPFYLCYCSPFVGTILHTTTANYMTNVNITSTTLNNTTTAVGPGGYTRADHTIPTNTATLSQTTPYNLNVSIANANYIVESWIDFDHSGTFDVSEYTLLTNLGTIAGATITIPQTALTGLTGLRVRVYQTTGYGSAGPCTSIATGYETEDYVVTITTPPACQQPGGLAATNITSLSADVSWSPVSGAALGYEWAVDQSSTAAPGGSSIINSTSSTTPPTVTGLTSSNTYYLHVRSNCGGNSYSLWSVSAFSTPPPNDACLNAVDITNGQIYNGTTTGATQSQAPCMTGTTVANDVWYSFTTGSVGGSVTVTVVTTGLMDVVIEALSGACGGLTGMVPTASTTLSGTCIDGPAAGAEFGTYTVSPFTTYYVRVYGFVSAEGVFTIQATGAPLSIKLKDINAVNVGARNRVNWTTADEIKGDKFIMERSSDGNNYIPLATINAKGQPAVYTYWDETPLTGVNHYRLKMIDVAGGLSYSRSVTAIVKSNGTFSVEAFPNPVSDLLSIRAYGTSATEANIIVTDVTGKTISSYTMKNGTVDIDMTGFGTGVYFVRYLDDTYSSTIKVNKK